MSFPAYPRLKHAPHEYFMGGKIYIRREPQAVGVTWQGGILKERAVAEASLIGMHPKGKSAYINRVVVQPDELRGHGIGSKIFGLLVDELRKQDYGRIIVEPGGYNVPREKQVHFYERFGFTCIKDDDGFEHYELLLGGNDGLETTPQV